MGRVLALVLFTGAAAYGQSCAAPLVPIPALVFRISPTVTYQAGCYNPTTGAITISGLISGGAYQQCAKTFSATPTFDLSSTSGGNTCRAFSFGALTANVTAVTISNPDTARASFDIVWTQDAMGGRTVSGLPVTAIGWCSPSTAASSQTIQHVLYDGTNYLGDGCVEVNGTGTLALISSVQSGVYLYCAPASASAITYTCSLSPTLTAYASGMGVLMKIDTACTGGVSTTLNINGLGAKRIYKADGSTDPASSDCTAGRLVTLGYDGTAFRILGGGATSSSGTSTFATRTVSLSSADILNLENTGIEIIPAPGANKFIQVISAVAVLTAGGTAYVGGGNPFFTFGGRFEQSALITGLQAALITSATDAVQTAVPSGGVGPHTLANTVNKAIWLVSGTDFTTGNGTLKVSVSYVVLDTI